MITAPFVSLCPNTPFFLDKPFLGNMASTTFETQWQATQTQMKMTLQRNVYGIALPLRTMMEKRLVAEVSVVATSRIVD